MKGSIPIDQNPKEHKTLVEGFTHFIKLFREMKRRNKSGKEIPNKK
jgi:hypothetical protein